MTAQTESSCPLLSLSEMMSPVSDFWQQSNHNSGSVPLSLQRDVSEAYFMKLRCEEELSLLQIEMDNVIDYWEQKEKCIKNLLLQLEGTVAHDQYQRGCISLLHKLLWEVQYYKSKHFLAFSSVNGTAGPDSDTSDYSDSSSDEQDF